MKRRTLLATPLAAAAAPPAKTAAFEIAPVYARLDVRTVINAVGTVTTLGGTLMAPEVLQAMQQAARNYVPIHELHEKVGARIAELTGAEAAFVTNGAAAALCLAACAVTAGDDRAKMSRLPDIAGMKSRIVIQKRHRTSYDHAFRMTGVKLVVVETADEMRSAIDNDAAAVAFVASHGTLGHKVELEETLAIAHKAGVPLILDAAAEIPPASNLSKFVKMGVDMVAFSGGKNLRGPQSSGILMGKKEWIRKAYANSSPNSYLPRIAKVGKEEIIGLLTALELYLAKDHDAERREHHRTLDRLGERLKGIPTLATELVPNGDFSHSPRLSVQWDESSLGVTLSEMVERLRKGNPSIEATDMRSFSPPWKGLGIFPYNLKAGEELIIADRIRQILVAKA